jgi:hypothetical protein
MRRPILLVLAVTVMSMATLSATQPPAYQSLLKLFEEFVAFERPPMPKGAPDYTAASQARRRTQLAAFQLITRW